MNWYEEDEWLLAENAKGEGPRYWDALEQNRRLVNKIYDEIEINPGRDNEDLTRTAEKWRLEKFAKKNRNKFVKFLSYKRNKGEKILQKKDPRLHSTELLREFKDNEDLTRKAEKGILEKFAKKNRNKFVNFLSYKRKKGEKILQKKDPGLHSTELLREFKKTQKGGRRKSRRRRRKTHKRRKTRKCRKTRKRRKTRKH